MKRFFVLVLAICMLMSAAALAEQQEVLQDEQPPKVVATVNEAGEAIVAKICDAAGNVIAEIKDDGTLVLTDVHNRSEATDSAVVQRLTGAYEDVMDDVHHSDVECLLHEHDVKVDINTILASLDKDIDAHDLIMSELFDVMLTGENAVLLTDGSYLELTFELTAEQSLPEIIMFSANGAEWSVIDHTRVGDKRFTVKLTKPGALALLNDGHEIMDIGESVQRVVTVIPGEEGGEYGLAFANFTPSVSGKIAPQMVTFEGTDGEVYVGYIRNNNGDVEIPVPDRNYIIVASVAERDYVEDILTHEHLEWGYDSILNAQDVGDLFTEHNDGKVIPADEHTTIAEALDAALQQKGLDLTHDQLVVKDLFEVTAYGDYLHYLYDENYYLEVTFDANLDASKPLVVIHSADSVHWHVHPIEESKLNADGTVTLKMYDMGAVAFLVEAEEEVNAETAVQSPN